MGKNSEKSLVRLLVMGDPHISELDLPLWDQAIADINELSPEAVLIVGDLTGYGGCGTPEYMRRAMGVLAGLRMPWFSVIGNHDLEAPEFATDEAAVASFLGFVGRETPWFRQDFGPMTVLGLSTTQFRQNPATSHEVVYSPVQLAWVEAQLQELGERPVLILAHVPPLGCGVISMAELHSHNGNAVANQNHHPGEVMALIWRHPNILAWFSGHNHLGQHYRDAISVRLGVHFVHTGVIGRVTRDGYRHSRLLEVYADRLEIQTFDHSRRRINAELTRVSPFSLGEHLAYRQRIHRRTMVPSDPATGYQGPGPQMARTGTVRFAFLSDSHLVLPLNPVQQRVLEWAQQQVRAWGVDQLILGGDLTHHADAAQAEAFLTALQPGRLPLTFLPGNNEGPSMALNPARWSCLPVRTVTRLPWPGAVFVLPGTDVASHRQALAELAELLPASGPALILAHFPPEAGGNEALAPLLRAERPMTWICGHLHQGEDRQLPHLRLIVCAGLDPVKVRGTMPEIVAGDWDGQTLAVQRWHAPRDLLSPPPRCHANPLGLAFQSSAEDLLETALELEIPVLQFRYGMIGTTPSLATRTLAARFRERFGQESFLSLHLPAFKANPLGPDLADQETPLAWAAALGVDDLTIHLPGGAVAQLYDAQQEFQDSEWSRQCRQRYLTLAERALAMGARLSLENLYNKAIVPPAEELLSCRPWHLLRLVAWLRAELAKRGHAKAAQERIGVIFDSGHAFNDPLVSKVHGLGDWVTQLAPVMHLAHIHQVLPVAGKLTNHHPISELYGPRINYAGLLPMIQEIVPRRVPLLIEVREREAALLSWRTVTGHSQA
jgi:predicted MPP superfamily phosphohydrolase